MPSPDRVVTVLAARGLGDAVCALPACYAYARLGFRVNVRSNGPVQFARTLPTLLPIGTEVEGTVLDLRGGMGFGEEARALAAVSLRLGVYPLALPDGPWLERRPEHERMVRALGVPAGYVVVAPQGSDRERRLEARQVAEVAAGWPTVVVHADRLPDFDELPVTNLTGLTTLPELYALLACARAAVCVDSGPLHAAAAFRTPVLAVVGGTLNPCALCEDYRPSLWLSGSASYAIAPEDLSEGLCRLEETAVCA